MSDNRCVCCGEIIPEGMIACPNCLVVSKKKDELPLGMMLSPYEQGEWDMFNLITSANYGKQYYFLESNGMVYSRESHKYMTREEAYEEYLKGWGH